MPNSSCTGCLVSKWWRFIFIAKQLILAVPFNDEEKNIVFWSMHESQGVMRCLTQVALSTWWMNANSFSRGKQLIWALPLKMKRIHTVFWFLHYNQKVIKCLTQFEMAAWSKTAKYFIRGKQIILALTLKRRRTDSPFWYPYLI